MKHFFLVALIFGFGILTRAQTEYEVSGDGTQKILKGIISRDLLTKDPAFSWWQTSQAGYSPNAVTVAVLRANHEHLRFLVFGGTWNEETQSALPKFFSLLDAASFPSDRVTLIGVDRQEQALGHLSEEMHITRIPTLILLKDGKECGRIVGADPSERSGGKGKRWDEELQELTKSLH